MVPLIDGRDGFWCHKDDHWGCCVCEVFVLNSMSHSRLLCQLYPWTLYKAAPLGTGAWDVGHWVPPARNPLHTAPLSLVRLTAALKLSWMSYMNPLLQAGPCPIPMSRPFFSLLPVLIKAQRDLFSSGTPQTLFYSILSTAVAASCCNVSQSLTADGARNEMEMSRTLPPKGEDVPSQPAEDEDVTLCPTSPLLPSLTWRQPPRPLRHTVGG